MADKLEGLIFSEFLVDNPSGFDTDGDGTANKSDEFIELQNTTGSSISLDGYQLWSDDRGLLYSFGSGATIASGGTATVVGEYAGTEPAGFYDAGLADGGDFLEDGEGSRSDTIYLVNTATGEYIAFSYGQPPPSPSPPTGFPGTTQIGTGESLNSSGPNGTSFARDANGDWVESTPPNPGSPGVACFTAGTMITTPDGARLVETLQIGDLVTTLDNGAQPILWIASRTLGQETLTVHPELRPIALEPRWTGFNERLLLSRQHAILVRSSANQNRVLARAGQLAQLEGGAVRVANGVRKITYVHFMLPNHEVVFANGLATESFYPGEWAIVTLAPISKRLLLALFPGYNSSEIADAYGSPKFPYAKRRDLPTQLVSVCPENIESPSCQVA
ncbi:Hint domain-containing protein [Roseovarius phycicola]|uniref:Hint domain-containing protein n=1 Tax=Roseovarius phycicola TaxID=3080976 RepID=A0ABZ2HNM1_9RHOB